MIQVSKIDGTKQAYSEDKIRASADRVGVPTSLQSAMIDEIRTKLYDGIPTTEIFAIIREYLNHSESPHLAAKYNLKQALALLGPSGYPFEQYIAELLKGLDYSGVKTNQIIAGRCVDHEVDVVGTKDDITYYIEAKFHSKPAQRSDVKVSLYISARYQDIAEQNPSEKTQSWIITNTRFTTEAEKYARCRNIRLTSWGYPKGEGIMDLIEQTNLHPITILDGLTKDELRQLLGMNIVTCQQLIGNKEAASLISSSRRQAVLSEATLICQSH